MNEPRLPTIAEQETIEHALLLARLLRPYYSRALAALSPRVMEGLGTVCVTKYWGLYVDVEWLRELDPLHQATVLAAHEVEHLLRRHSRLDGLAPPFVTNVIADAEINDDLANGEALLPGAITPSRFGWPDGLTAEEYLALIEQTTHLDGAGCCGGGSGAGYPRPWEKDDSSDGVNENDAEMLRQQVAGDVVAYGQEHGRGSVPQDVLIWANALIAPIVRDWRRELPPLLAKAVTLARGRYDYSWARPSRRAVPGVGVLRPASIGAKLRIGLAVDTSGSMASDTLDYVAGLVRSFGDVVVAQGDAALCGISSGAPNTWRGGGGSDIRPLIEALVKARVDAIVCVTDCETAWPSDSPSVPVVVVSTGNAEAPTWAKTVRI